MAAFWPQVVLASYIAGADLSAAANQYTFVKLNTSGEVVAVTAITDIPIGVLQNLPKAGATAEVVMVGGTKLKASAAITLPAILGTASDGRAAKLAAGTATTVYVVGQADTPAGAANEIFSAVINTASPARAA